MSKFVVVKHLLSLVLILIYRTNAQTVPPLPPAGNPRNGKGGCNYVKTSAFGNIVSPGYPVKYPPGAACTWTINSAQGTVIRVVFNDFYIEGSTDCLSDYLLLYDGKDSSSKLVGRYCNIAPDTFTSSSNSVRIEFYSDSSLNYKGFHAYYSTMPATTVKPTLPWKRFPKFTKPLLNVTVTEGNLVKLTCEVQGVPTPSITWRKDSQNLTKSDHIVVDDSTLKSTLTINNAAVTDSGVYTCDAFNGFGPAIKSNAWVRVKTRELPLIKKITENKTVTVGTRVKLKCKAHGPAPLKMRWIEKGKQLGENTCQSSQDCKIELTKEILEKSVIACEVVNNVGRVAQNILIKVKGPPLITHPPQNKRMPLGLSVNFSCKAVGNPPVKISWMQDNKSVSDGVITLGGMSVLQLTVEKESTVTCSAQDQDGVTSSDAQLTVTDLKTTPQWQGLQFVKRPSSATVEYKSTPTLECQAKGYPRPELSWMMGDVIITNGVEFNNGVSTLTLTPVEETVNVSCIAKNADQEIKSTATLTTRRDPRDGTDALVSEADTINDDMKLILGAVGGILLLTIIIIILLLLRRRKHKKILKETEKVETPAVENENLISNPLFNSEREESGTSQGVEVLHYPLENIVHCEDIADDDKNMKLFVGTAADLPYSTGEQKVLVKMMKDSEPSEDKKKQFMGEASLLADFDHNNVVRLMAVCIQTPPLALVFEYSEYGYLDEYLQDCDPSGFPTLSKRKAEGARDSYTELGCVDRLSIAKQIAAGMQYLAEKGYVHQELRARNCMVFKNLQVKVANLGMRWVKPEQNFFAMNTAEKRRYPVRWLAPEVILYGEQEYSELADVWSFGVLMWEVFSDGLLPYTGISNNDVVSYVRGCNVLPRPKTCSEDVYEVLKACWQMMPTDRPNFASLFGTMSSLHSGVRV